MITITDTAAAQIAEILAAETDKTLKLRIFVQGGGCSGFQQGFTLDSEQAEDDWDLLISGIPVLVDSLSMQYLEGSEIDYYSDAMGGGFAIKNTRFSSTCGCGSSFSM
jgi:iron-sulfur cluster insertion protein